MFGDLLALLLEVAPLLGLLMQLHSFSPRFLLADFIDTMVTSLRSSSSLDDRISAVASKTGAVRSSVQQCWGTEMEEVLLRNWCGASVRGEDSKISVLLLLVAEPAGAVLGGEETLIGDWTDLSKIKFGSLFMDSAPTDGVIDEAAEPLTSVGSSFWCVDVSTYNGGTLGWYSLCRWSFDDILSLNDFLSGSWWRLFPSESVVSPIILDMKLNVIKGLRVDRSDCKQGYYYSFGKLFFSGWYSVTWVCW